MFWFSIPTLKLDKPQATLRHRPHMVADLPYAAGLAAHWEARSGGYVNTSLSPTFVQVFRRCCRRNRLNPDQVLDYYCARGTAH